MGDVEVVAESISHEQRVVKTLVHESTRRFTHTDVYRRFMFALFFLSGNVAYGKFTSQSGGSGYLAMAAVDGNTNSLIYNKHCAHPEAKSGTNAWWMVDFGEKYRIGRVVIYNRGDCCEYNSDTAHTSCSILQSDFCINIRMYLYK